MPQHKAITEQLRARVLAVGSLRRTSIEATIAYGTIHKFAKGGQIDGVTVDRLGAHFGLTLAPRHKSTQSGNAT